MTLEKRKSQGVTLVELLVVVSVISLLLAILLPALGRVREIARTATCAAHMRSMASALMAYTTENRSHMPMATEFAPDPFPGAGYVNAPSWYTIFKHGSSGSTSYGITADALSCSSLAESNARYNAANQQLEQIPGLAQDAGHALNVDYGINGCYAMRNDKNLNNVLAGSPFRWGSTTNLQHVSSIISFAECGDVYFASSSLDPNTPFNQLRYRHKGNRAINVAMFDGHAETWDFSDIPADPQKKITSYDSTAGNVAIPWRDRNAPAN